MRRLTWMLGLGTLVALPAAAQEQDTTEIQRLRAQVEAITRELEALRLGEEVIIQADTGLYGFGPAASKVYKVKQGVSIGGYGEVLYQNFARSRQDNIASGRTDQVDALRAIVYVGYKFSDKLLFNSEVELEHAGGEVGLEFGYIDYRLTPQFGLRGGLLLPPMGFINESHEPPTFLGTTRPEVEQAIIPTTWRENGIGFFGSAGSVSYRAYLVNGFNATGFSATGLREGRQEGSEAIAQNFAGVGRLDYTGVLGLTVGASAYWGNAGQGAVLPSDSARTIRARTFIGEVHAEYKARGLDLRGLLAMATVGGAAAVNELSGLSGDASVGERLVGWYVQGGYNVLRGTATSHQLVPYVRYERLNTQYQVPNGFAANPATDRGNVLLGALWKPPVANVALKADYQLDRNEGRSGVNRINVNLSYLF